MSSNDHALGTTAETKAAFRAALERLVSGKPRETRNAALAAEGKLRVNIASVAREAGRSRTLVGVKACAYLDERNAILAAANPSNGKGAATSASKLIDALRADKRNLEQHARLLATRLNDAVLVERELRKRCATLEDQLTIARR